jgi:ribosome biogenesis GTPase
VGKSTLVNRLVGAELMATGDVREDDSRGRHTTSHRQLVRLPEGGLVIDTPGMREIQLWAEEDSLEGTFVDVTEVAEGCRFRDCRHEREPGCAVREAVAAGRLDADRLESYFGLRAELETLHGRQAEAARREERRQGRRMGRLRQEVRRTNPKYK